MHSASSEDHDLEEYVENVGFDQECLENARKSLSSDERRCSSDNESESSAATAESSPHEPSRIESRLYYHGIREHDRGPKLIYRDSSDIYEEPTGPEAYKRLMRLVAVPDNHEFGQNGLWETVRDKVRVPCSNYAAIS